MAPTEVNLPRRRRRHEGHSRRVAAASKSKWHSASLQNIEVPTRFLTHSKAPLQDEEVRDFKIGYDAYHPTFSAPEMLADTSQIASRNSALDPQPDPPATCFTINELTFVFFLTILMCLGGLLGGLACYQGYAKKKGYKQGSAVNSGLPESNTILSFVDIERLGKTPEEILHNVAPPRNYGYSAAPTPSSFFHHTARRFDGRQPVTRSRSSYHANECRRSMFRAHSHENLSVQNTALT